MPILPPAPRTSQRSNGLGGNTDTVSRRGGENTHTGTRSPRASRSPVRGGLQAGVRTNSTSNLTTNPKTHPTTNPTRASDQTTRVRLTMDSSAADIPPLVQALLGLHAGNSGMTNVSVARKM